MVFTELFRDLLAVLSVKRSFFVPSSMTLLNHPDFFPFIFLVLLLKNLYKRIVTVFDAHFTLKTKFEPIWKILAVNFEKDAENFKILAEFFLIRAENFWIFP